MSRLHFLLASLPLAVAACDAKPETAPAPVASVLAPSTAPSASPATARTFLVDPTGTTRIDMPGKDEHIQARTTAAGGSLTIDAAALQNSRGEVRIDLGTLTTSTFDDEKKNAEQTKHARTWLETVVDGVVHEEHRWAVLAVRSVDVAGATSLASVPLTGGLRTVKAVVHGDVLIHGHRVERAVPVVLDFSYGPGAAATAPGAVRIRTEKPMNVVLKEHEVMPRDPVGKLLKWTSELTNRVATDAHVDVDLKASAP